MGACNISIKCFHIGRDSQLDVSEHKIDSRESWHRDQPHFFRLSRWFRDEIYPVMFLGGGVRLEEPFASGKNNQEFNSLKSKDI